MGLLAQVSMRQRRWLGVLSVVALLLVGCKDSDGGEKGAPTTTTTAPSTPSSTGEAGGDAAKVAKAKAAVLQMSDLPPGWTTQPPDAGLNIENVWEDLTRCVGVQNAAPPAGRATSETYLMGLATQARSTVEYTTESAAAASASALAGPRFQGCAMDAFRADVERSKPEGSTTGSVQVAPRDYPQLGQKTLAWRIDATVNLQDLQVPLFQDYLVIFNGGTVIRFFFLNPGSEFPQTLERSLVDKVISRA